MVKKKMTKAASTSWKKFKEREKLRKAGKPIPSKLKARPPKRKGSGGKFEGRDVGPVKNSKGKKVR